MIPAGVQVFVALEPVDLRSGFDRLAGLAQQHTGYDARSGALFVFIGRRGTATKVLFFNGASVLRHVVEAVRMPCRMSV